MTSLEPFTTFGDLLKYLRRRARLTQQQLAAAVGYSREQITKLENHQRSPDPTAVKALFLPALELEQEPEFAAHLLELAESARIAKLDSPTPTVRLARTNLPTGLNSFIGREHEIAELKRLMASARLVAILGAGGAGKTRLAQQVGLDVLDTFPDGVWFVELAPISDPDLAPHAVAAALGIPPGSGRLLDSVLADYLRDRNLLLILDNCEHLLVACARLAESLLQAAPRLRILATSRESLGILGGTMWRVPSLNLPHPLSVEEVEASEAGRLFVDRAMAVKPDFSVTPHNAPFISQICSRLDGMPLAIELAATRVRALSLEHIASRLDDRFQLLTGGSITALPRHQTLRALIDWSYDLLTEPEQAFLRHLSIFAGGWTLEAAEQVTETDQLHSGISTLDLLTSLVDKSLVVVDETEFDTRYDLLETIREYAREKLVEAAEAEQARDHHLAYYARLVEESESHLQGSQQKIWYQRFDAEHDNLRAALDCAIRNHNATSLRLVSRLWFFWFWRGYWREGTAWVMSALANTAGDKSQVRVRARALIGGSNLAGRMGDYAQFELWLAEGATLAESLGDQEYMAWARIGQSLQTTDYAQVEKLLKEAASLARQAGNTWLAADTLFMLGDRARGNRDFKQAEALYAESAALFRQVGDRDLIGNPLGNLGRLAFQRGDYAAAQSAFEESIALFREMGNKPGLADWLLQLALVALYRNEYERVHAALAECLPLCRDIGNLEAIADCLVIAAGLAEATDHFERAARLLASANRLLETSNQLHSVVDPDSYNEYTRRIESVRARLDESRFDAVWQEGTALTIAQSIEAALSTGRD